VAHALTRLLLATYLARPPTAIRIDRSCRHCGGAHGKPRLADARQPLEFSVSHSQDRIVVACSWDLPVGVDVEWVERGVAVEELLPHVLSAEETEKLRRVDGRERLEGFFVYWTRKEAALKATGHGLIVPLVGVGVSGPGMPPSLTRWPAGHELARTRLHDLHPGAGYRASLATMGECRRVRELDGSALLVRYCQQIGSRKAGEVRAVPEA